MAILRRAVVVTVLGTGVVVLARDLRTLHAAATALAGANPCLVLATAALAATTYLGAALALRAASDRDLPLGRTTAVQLAATCANRITPAGIGGMATNIGYLEHDGAGRRDAVAAVGLTSVASFAVHAILTTAALLAAGRSITGMLRLPVSWPVALVVLVGIVGLLGTVAVRHDSGRLHARAREVVGAVTRLATSPRRLGALLLGTLLVTLGHGAAFATAAGALGLRLPVLGLLGVFLTGSALAAGAPTPGGLGALEGALAAGLTGLGAPAAPAIASVLAYRLVTYWFPVVPGAVALAYLRRVTSAADTPISRPATTRLARRLPLAPVSP